MPSIIKKICVTPTAFCNGAGCHTQNTSPNPSNATIAEINRWMPAAFNLNFITRYLQHPIYLNLLARTRQTSFAHRSAAFPSYDLAVGWIGSRSQNHGFTTISALIETNRNHTITWSNFSPSGRKVFTFQSSSTRHNRATGRRIHPRLPIVCANIGFQAFRSLQSFRCLGSCHIILIRRHSNSRQNTNNSNHNHEFDQGKTTLNHSHIS